MSSSRRFVVSSLGSIGKRHLRNLRQLRPDAEIAVLRRSHDEGALPEGCDRVFLRVEDALHFRPHAAILAGPAPTHVPLARVFVDDGVAVLVEKPLSHDLAGLSALADAARARRVPVMVGYNLRFNPSLRTLREKVEDGAIGEILAVRAEVGQYLPSWRPDTDYRHSVSARSELGGGPLLELSHEIDYLYWMFGMPERVTCRGGRLSNLEIDVEDCVELCLEYENPRRLVSIHLDFLQRSTTRTCKLIGSRGTIRWDALADRVVVDTIEPATDRRVIEKAVPDRNEMYLAELTAFLTALDHDAAIPIPLEDGIAVMRIVAAARQSLLTGMSEVPCLVEDVA